jgi:hypothetical protein
MPSIVTFNNRQVVEPGSYAQIIGGATLPPTTDTFGVVTLIDTGSGAGYGGGSGVNGTLYQGNKTVYTFTNMTDSQNFLGGGLLWDLMTYFWNPSNGNAGPQALNIIRAATTVAATSTIQFNITGGSISETKATATVTVQGIITNGQSYYVQVAGTTIGTIVKTSGETTLSLIATAIAAAISADSEGYTAVATVAAIAITGYTGSGATLNDITVTLIENTTVTQTQTFSGGVTAQPATVETPLIVSALNEGLRGNGATIVNLSSQTVLSRGFGYRVSSGIVNTSAFIVTFYAGQYRGQDSNGVEYQLPENTMTNFAVATSVEFTTMAGFVTWALNDFNFNSYFQIPAGTIGTTTLLTSAFITNNSGWQLFAAGTETFNSTDVDSVLTAIVDLDNDFFLCDDYGINPAVPVGTSGGNKGAQSINNTKILSYIVNTSTYTGKTMFVGGGNTHNEFSRPSSLDGSIETAEYYNSANVAVVHSGILGNLTVPTNGQPFRTLTSLYHAAMVCGRTAGLAPQVPVTYKSISIKGLQDELSQSDRVRALRAGVLHTRYVPQMGWVVNQGINTLAPNDYLIYPPGTSPEIQVMRIEHQMNKTIVQNSTPLFVGGNRNTVSPTDIQAFVIGYLSSITATTQVDNLIISFSKVTVTLVGSDYQINYCFVVNGPINRLFYTGVILDPSVTIGQ